MDIQQGDIYWVHARDLDIEGSEQKKNRPYVIVSRLRINKLGKNVVGVPLSTKLEKACWHRILIPLQFMVKDLAWPLQWPSGDPRTQLSTSVALTDHIRVLDKSRLTQPRMGRLSSTAIAGLELALNNIFESTQNLDETPPVPQPIV